jgi:hypothetical protein
VAELSAHNSHTIVGICPLLPMPAKTYKVFFITDEAGGLNYKEIIQSSGWGDIANSKNNL